MEVYTFVHGKGIQRYQNVGEVGEENACIARRKKSEELHTNKENEPASINKHDPSCCRSHLLSSFLNLKLGRYVK